ncbi:hypothetical protein [Staphylococcus aureus]
MSEWHINNQSTKPFLIQQAEKQLSIVKPLPNGSFQILTEINLENGNISNIDHFMLAYLVQLWRPILTQTQQPR